MFRIVCVLQTLVSSRTPQLLRALASQECLIYNCLEQWSVYLSDVTLHLPSDHTYYPARRKSVTSRVLLLLAASWLSPPSGETSF